MTGGLKNNNNDNTNLSKARTMSLYFFSPSLEQIVFARRYKCPKCSFALLERSGDNKYRDFEGCVCRVETLLPFLFVSRFVGLLRCFGDFLLL